jgi:hypothetical protein
MSLELGGDEADQGDDDQGAGLDHRFLKGVATSVDPTELGMDTVEAALHATFERVEALVDGVETLIYGVEALVDGVEASVGVRREIVQPGVGPTFPHRLHPGIVADKMSHVGDEA